MGLQLQRQSLEAKVAHEKCNWLRRENDCLKEEVALLRATPDTTPHSASLQVSELSLSLRKVSDRLGMTESLLLDRTTELEHAKSRIGALEKEVTAMRRFAASTSAQADKSKAKEKMLGNALRAAQEEKNLAEFAVQEYATYARTLESSATLEPSPPRYSPASSISSLLVNLNPAEHVLEGKIGLQKLLHEYNEETLRYQDEVNLLTTELNMCQTKLGLEMRRGEEDRTKLALARVELDQYKIDDSAASKMVSRYM